MPRRENDAVGYGVNVEPAQVQPGEPFWMAVRIHHLTPEENGGRHHIFLDILDEEGNRIYGAQAEVTWPGGSQVVTIDKPLDEPGTNFPMWAGQICAVEVVWPSDGALPSDRVIGLHTGHPDEAPGNTLFHHSFLIVFQKVTKEAGPSQSVIQGEVVGGAGKTIMLIEDGEAVEAQVIGDDERFRFAGLSAGTYSLEVAGTELKVSDIEVDGQQVITLRLVLEEIEKKPIFHYVLFGSPDRPEVLVDFVLATDYILRFAPAVGFSLDEAANAEHVTIIGSPDRVSLEDESYLEAMGCKVQRIQGDAYQIKRTLEELIEADNPFLS